jgi:hypothetical protein
MLTSSNDVSVPTPSTDVDAPLKSERLGAPPRTTTDARAFPISHVWFTVTAWALLAGTVTVEFIGTLVRLTVRSLMVTVARVWTRATISGGETLRTGGLEAGGGTNEAPLKLTADQFVGGQAPEGEATEM